MKEKLFCFLNKLSLELTAKKSMKNIKISVKETCKNKFKLNRDVTS